MKVSLIFPHQLFHNHPAIDSNNPVYMIEEELFFKQFLFHKQKIVLHKASMQAYASELREKNNIVTYIESNDKNAAVDQLMNHLGKLGVTNAKSCFPNDAWLKKRVDQSAKKNKINIEWIEGPDFLTGLQEIDDFFKGKKHYHQTDFYIYQRKKLNLLLEEDKTPLGGKWTFDADNRKKLPKEVVIPLPIFPASDKHLQKAQKDVELEFANNPGSTELMPGQFPWAWTRKQALDNLQHFLTTRFHHFGEYEDAIAKEEHFIFHSLLSPSINIGLITPREVVDEAISYTRKHNVPLNSTEGFIRQIVGWREFIRATYLLNGNIQRTKNFWGFKRKIPSSFYNGTAGIPPIDDVIKKILKSGYAHHIERLMVLGNFFLLCEFDPDEVHRWFMEMFVDAYDWVMVPNVYGMTQFADGGTITTKPYISGSNYLFKMSDYKKEKTDAQDSWHFIWDSLFWNFMHKQRQFFLKNPRLGMLVHTFDKMSAQKQNDHIHTANAFFKKLDNAAEAVT